MKVYVETNPETIYSGRVKDEVKTTEIRMWFETDEEIEVLPLADYTKQVRKEVYDEIRKWCNRNFNWVGGGTSYDGQDYNEMIGSNNTINKPRSDILAMENYLSLLKKQSQQIADLEAKLADSEKQVKHWHNLYNGRDKQFQSVRQRYHLLNKLQSNYDKKDKLHLAYMQCAELVNENEKLKQQLDEKDKEISNLNGLIRERDKQIKNLKTNKKRVIEHKNKTKISFCIEQLEKVKELCREKFNWWENSEWEGDIYDKADVSNAYFDIEVNIEEKIKQLKEMCKND